jgi:hypothetical protein
MVSTDGAAKPGRCTTRQLRHRQRHRDQAQRTRRPCSHDQPGATIEGYVTSAEQNGGGWVQLTFHHICNGCDAYSITTVDMRSLLDWLSTQVTGGAVAVKTTEQVIGGTYVTPFCC